MPQNNKVGLIQFTILTTVSMTDGIIMLPTMVATVGAISIYACIQCGMDSVTYGMVAVLVGLMIYGLYAVRLQTPYRSHRMR